MAAGREVVKRQRRAWLSPSTRTTFAGSSAIGKVSNSWKGSRVEAVRVRADDAIAQIAARAAVQRSQIQVLTSEQVSKYEPLSFYMEECAVSGGRGLWIPVEDGRRIQARGRLHLPGPPGSSQSRPTTKVVPHWPSRCPCQPQR